MVGCPRQESNLCTRFGNLRGAWRFSAQCSRVAYNGGRCALRVRRSVCAGHGDRAPSRRSRTPLRAAKQRAHRSRRCRCALVDGDVEDKPACKFGPVAGVVRPESADRDGEAALSEALGQLRDFTLLAAP
jgi:hypothetical protein